MKPFNWKPHGAEYRAEMPGEITLVVSPDYVKDFGSKPKRGTTWRAGVSQWTEATRTISRYGRDEYAVRHKTYKEAMRVAEKIYEAEASRAEAEASRAEKFAAEKVGPKTLGESSS